MECKRKIQKPSIAENDGLCLIEKLLEKLDEDDLEFVSCLARTIWPRRNSIVFGGVLTPLVQQVKTTEDYMADFNQAFLAPGNDAIDNSCQERQK